jgi:hypothetical protein
MGFTLAGRASAPFSLRVLFAGITTLALVGCAGTTVRDVSDQTPDTTENEADQDARGIRYYERAPFILVHSDGKGGLVSELLFIEDTTRKRAIRPYAVLSQNKSELTFSFGTLTGAKTTIDETTVPVALVQAAQNIAVALAKAFLDSARAAAPQEMIFPAPSIFRIVKLKDGRLALRGGPAHKPGQPGVNQDIILTIPTANGS